MNEEKIGYWMLGLLLVAGLLVACYAFFYAPREPLFTVRVGKPAPVATPVEAPTAQPQANVFHQVILEQAQTDNQIKLEVTRHELRREWACIAAPWVMIILGVVCFVMAWRKWLSS